MDRPGLVPQSGMAGFPGVAARGLPHHVTRRGKRRQQTFFSDEDFSECRRPITECCRSCGTDLSAAGRARALRRYAILLRLGASPNHPGLVVRCFSAAHPPAWDDAPESVPDWDRLQQSEPDFELGQRVAW